jgi:Vitamin K-dependent gamma-carboxylase
LVAALAGHLCRQLAGSIAASNRFKVETAPWHAHVGESIVGIAARPVSAAQSVCQRARGALINFADRPADPLTAGFVRILSAAIGIWYAASLTGFIELNWYSQTPIVRTSIFYLHGFWIGTLVLFLLGIGGRPVAFLQLAIAVFVFNGDDLKSTISSDLYLITSFWLSFTRLDARLRLVLPRRFQSWFPVGASGGSAPPNAWPLMLLGFNVGVLLFTSGLAKLFDPFWIRGIGFYETFALPWVKAPEATALLESKPLMTALNYGSIAVEILFLPLLCWKRTRALACILLIAFFALLTYPIRIDFIGPIGIVQGIALAAAVPSLGSGITRLAHAAGLSAERRAFNAESTADNGLVVASSQRLLKYAAVFVFIVYVCFWGVYSAASVSWNPWFSYPLARAQSVPHLGPAEVAAPRFWLESIRRRVVQVFENSVMRRTFFVPFALVNQLTTRMGPRILFCDNHFLGTYEYRVTVALSDGRELEPVAVFNPDKTGGRYSVTPGSPRCLQRLMYDVTQICQERLRDPQASRDHEDVTLERLIHFSLSKLAPQDRAQATRIAVLVSPIVVPLSFEGDSRPWLNYPWTRLYERDARKCASRFCDPPIPHPYELVRAG